jgi:cytochrome c556
MQTKSKLASFGVLALTLIATGAIALDAASVIKARLDFYHGMGKSFKGLNEALKAPTPDLVAIRAYTAQINADAALLPAQFPAGSGPESGVKTSAKPEIWTNPTEFAKDAQGLQTAAASLNQAAQGTDIAAIQTALGATGQTCKTCHTTFRNQDH